MYDRIKKYMVKRARKIDIYSKFFLKNKVLTKFAADFFKNKFYLLLLNI